MSLPLPATPPHAEIAGSDTAVHTAMCEELATRIERFTGSDGRHETPIASLQLIRLSAPSEPTTGIQEPAFCLIAQGRKQIRLGEETYEYGGSRHLVASVDLPVRGRVIEASEAAPYLGLALTLSPAGIAALVSQAQSAQTPLPPPSRGMCAGHTDTPLLDAALRLVRLLDTPEDIPLLSPLILQEILYRLLRGEQGGMLRHIGVIDSQGHRVSRAIGWLRKHYDQPLRIEHIAREAHMSPSALHHHFKAVTAMSPLQYQKQLRLQEARRLMLSEVVDAATASHRVGYESPSQFSREYRRMFGAPPLRDVERLRRA